MPADYSSTARSLALPVDEDIPDGEDPMSPSWRRQGRGRFQTRDSSDQPRGYRDRLMYQSEKLGRQTIDTFLRLSRLQQGLIVLAWLTFLVLGILFLVYNHKIFAWLGPVAEKWRDIPGGWLILWAATFVVSFPPLIGYSTCVTLGGFVYGMKGWFIIASATIVGSTASFMVSRTLLSGYAKRLVANDKRFAALSLVLKHDGLKLLCMIRLCPLPYSLSNGAISTVPTVQWVNFAVATAMASPKLLIHIFIGSRIAAIAGEKMDFQTKLINYLSIAFGMILGIATGVIIYRQTKLRAEELEAEEEEDGGVAQSGVSGRYEEEYADNVDQARPLNRRGSNARQDEYQDYLSDEEVDDDVFRLPADDDDTGKDGGR
ncbi:MAG: Tlg2-vesicle protein [Chrysothrix sp. TS-e1954]|nr:MAG: Tlg2-vesicle protein [Chrysothrix sp. TS-e1954]